MSRYRIKEYKCESRVYYDVQKKSIFGFWYNTDNIDSFKTLDEADEYVKQQLAKVTTRIVKFYK